MVNIKLREYLILNLFLAVLILGCKENPNSELLTIPIPNRTDSPVLLSEMAVTDTRIKLETVDGALLGYVYQVKVHKNKLFVADKTGILVFDLEGNFLQILGRQGEGPGEYKSIASLDIDEGTGRIYVSANHKLLVYGPDLALVEDRKLGYPIGYLKILDGDLWIVSEEIGKSIGDNIANQTHIYRLGKNFEISDTIPFRTIILDRKRVGGYGFRFWLSDIEDGLFMYMPVLTPENLLRDTLYQVSGNKIEAALRFHFVRGQSLNEQDYQTLLLYNIVNSSSYYILEYDQDWERFMFL